MSLVVVALTAAARWQVKKSATTHAAAVDAAFEAQRPERRASEQARAADQVFDAELERLSGGGCPSGFEQGGAPKPRGAGVWCQRIDEKARRMEILRLDGTLWATVDGVQTGVSPEAEGTSTYFAADGKTVARIVSRENHETVRLVESLPVVDALPGLPLH